jgi:biofilm protein TabA
MKQELFSHLLMITFSVFAFGAYAQTDTSKTWTKKAAEKWFDQKEWLGGLRLEPAKSIDIEEFVRQYHLNKKYWDEAFAFMKDNDLQSMSPGKYAIDGDNVFAMVTEDATKDFDNTKWESHRNYIDLHYVISGEEKIGVSPVEKAIVTMPYDEMKDIANYKADGKIYLAKPGTFFIFFPENAHRPGITTGGNKTDKKLVIKIRAAG